MTSLPTLFRLAERGGAAERMIPVFPTNTFPNHVTLVTGVAPERHGIVNNVFLDPVRGLYRYESDPSWIEAEPIWSLLARRGIPSASYHWVGSEGAWRNGFGPRHWRPFDASVDESEKVDQILAWLDLPDPRERPRLVTCWFRGADRAAHRYGPGAARVAKTLRSQDGALARLLTGLEERELLGTTTLIVVSDHGMALVERSVDLKRALEREGLDAWVMGGGGFALVALPSGESRVERVVESARRLGLEAYPRGEAPAALRVSHPRFGDAVVLAPPGAAIVRRKGLAGLAERLGLGRLILRGAHGYRPTEVAMGALFVAFGRGVSAQDRLDTVRAVDVAPTVLALLGVPVPEWMEGRPIAALLSAERPGSEQLAPSGESR